MLTLVGRQKERAALDIVLDAASTGAGGTMVLRGEPGTGKTALLDYAVQRSGDLRVARVAGFESEMDLEYGALHPLLVPAGPGVTGFAVGDEVLGWSDSRSAQADFVLTDPGHLALKPLALDWVRAGSLWAAGVTSFAAVRAVSLHPGDVVAVSGAAGGLGAFAVQLARRAGARVLGVASERNADWLRSVDVEPLAYGSGLAGRLSNAAPGGVDAFIDTHGGGYVQLAVSLGVSPERIDTIIDFAGAAKFGAKTAASPEASTPTVLAAMADHVAWGRLVMPVAAVYPLERVRGAYAELAEGHAHGKIVLSTVLPADAKALRPT